MTTGRKQRTKAGKLGALLAGVSMAALCAQAQAEGDKWAPWIELGGAASTERHRGEITIFAPLAQNRTTLLFADARGKLFEAGAVEGNFALGVRHMLPARVNVGAWASLDVRETEFNNRFSQFAAGFEALTENFDGRLNGYVPVDNKATSGTSTTSAGRISGGTIVLDTTTTTVIERALYGFDAEVGARIPLDRMGWATDKHEAWVHAGGFHFDDGPVQGLTGPMARATYRINNIIPQVEGSRLSIRAEFKHDDVRDGQFEGVIRLRLPFGPNANKSRYHRYSALEHRMVERIERDIDIISTSSSFSETFTEGALDPNGQLINTVLVVDSSGNLQTALTNAGSNSVVVVDGSGGNVDTGNGVTMVANQTVLGGGASLPITGATSGASSSFTAPGSRPTIVNTTLGAGSNAVITTGTNGRVQGVTLVGNNNPGDLNNRGITSEIGTTGVVIEDVAIRDTGSDGILLRDNTTTTIRNTSIANVRDGLDVDDGAVVIVDNLSVNNARRAGIVFGETTGGSTITITNSSFSNILNTVPAHVIQIVGPNNSVTLNNTTFGGTLDENVIDIQAGSTGTTLAGSGNTIEAGAAVTGVVCDANGETFTGDVEISGTTYTSANCP